MNLLYEPVEMSGDRSVGNCPAATLHQKSKGPQAAGPV